MKTNKKIVREETPFSSQTRPPRPRRDTQPMANPNAAPTGAQTAPARPSEQNFNVVDANGDVYHVPAKDEQTARNAFVTWSREDSDNPQTVDPASLKVTLAPTNVNPRSEGVSCGNMGGQKQTTYDEAVVRAIRDMVKEVVRKKDGKFVLYGPNKGKKKNPKPSGEFPTRFAARKAELARFPPKDADQYKAAKKRLDDLTKDPKKRAAAAQKDATGGTAPKKTGAPKADRKKVKEQIIGRMVRDLRERLFDENEVPGSPWDERISSLHPEVIATDKKLAGLHKGIERASLQALSDGHRGMQKALKGMAKVNPGDVAHDPQRRKTFMPCTLDCDGTEIGPVHLYVDGGHVKVEVSPEARQQIAEMEPDDARNLRGGLMSFQEDHLPKIDVAKKAWGDRDNYLDKVHSKMDNHVNNMTGVEMHLAKQLLGKKGGRR